MPEIVSRLVAELPPPLAARVGGGSPFALVEHAWHLADLEREGYGVRITRMLAEAVPALPDFDGERLAREREYVSADATLGAAVFADARQRNVTRLRSLDARQLERSGFQEGVGPVTIADVAAMMDGHDRIHAGELLQLVVALAPRVSVREALVRHATATADTRALPDRALA
jgi:hypothetical protein